MILHWFIAMWSELIGNDFYFCKKNALLQFFVSKKMLFAIWISRGLRYASNWNTEVYKDYTCAAICKYKDTSNFSTRQKDIGTMLLNKVRHLFSNKRFCTFTLNINTFIL